MSFLGYNFSDVAVTEESADLYSESKNLKIFRSSTGASRWEWTIRFVGGRKDEMWNKFLAHYLANKNISFPLTLPQHWLQDDVANAESVLVASAVNSNLNTINIIATPGPIVIPEGRFISLAGNDKVYLVTGYDDGLVTLYPRLTKPVSVGTNVQVNNVVAQVKHSPSNVGITVRRGVIQSIRWNFIEAL